MLVTGSAIVWSTGGLIARHVETGQWNMVFYRGLFAAIALLAFLLLRDGRKTWSLFRNLGAPGLAVACCFAIASTSFVLALNHTTVATILFVQSTAPLIAGVLAWIWLGERMTWIRSCAMILALGGVAIMISDNSTEGDAIGIIFSIMIAFSIATATVLVRRYRDIRMAPATCLASLSLAFLGGGLGTPWEVGGQDIFLLFLFGAFQLALGLVLFTSGARLIPAGEAILLGLLEAILAPTWVWIWPSINEYPGDSAVIGGAIVLIAVVFATAMEMSRVRRIAPPME